MAISLVGVAENSSSASSFSVTLPTLAEDDVVYVLVGMSTALDSVGSTNTPSGYTSLVNEFDTVVTPARRLQVFRKVMGASPDASVTIARTGSSDITSAVAVCLRGVDTTTPEDTTTTKAGWTSSTNPDSPSITTANNNAWVISGFVSQINDAAVTAPSDYSNQVDRAATNAGANITVGAATKEVATAGAEDPASWTNVSSGIWYAVSIAVRSAPSLSSGNMLLMF
jgi:hypothetical protein